MKTGALIRLIVLSIVGIALVFLQRIVFEQRLLGIVINDFPGSLNLNKWLDLYFMRASLTVLITCLVTLIIWYVITVFFATGRSEEFLKWRLFWFLFLLMPLGSIAIAAFLINPVKQAQIPLTLFFTIDVIWLYWLTTVTSSPTPVKYVPPLAFPIRSGILGD
ncbi:MAG: hypothetical protein HC796_02365 [Synechococcaceae cyanobacterium RL_1_2]|nr:hypothetical protein [Synechococcaceae cyanobacterium RL_1_2]